MISVDSLETNIIKKYVVNRKDQLHKILSYIIWISKVQKN
jgi:hypothetical protein